MTNPKHNPLHNNNLDEDSGFITDSVSEPQLNLGNLFSGEFTNITPLYTSSCGSTQIWSATRYGKRFILKGLKDEYRHDPVYLMSLLKEFELGITLDHPNIRRTIGLETINGLGRVIVLEHIDGETLETLVKSGRLTPQKAGQIVNQIIDALEYIHSKEIFHRDLKPANILVSYYASQVKIIDFNLSDSHDFIVLKNPAGTRRYIAPEQNCANARPTALADIYSFGVILNDIASAISSHSLALIALQCCHPTPLKRPQLREIRVSETQVFNPSPMNRVLSSSLLTYILLICAVILTLILI